MATGSGITNRWIGFDVTFDGTTATNTPILCELVKTTAASSGGSAGTFNQMAGLTRTVQSTARINDTADGSSPTVLRGWLVPPTSGFAYQWPLGREPEMAASSFYEMRLTTVSGSGTPNYDVNVEIEE